MDDIMEENGGVVVCGCYTSVYNCVRGSDGSKKHLKPLTFICSAVGMDFISINK